MINEPTVLILGAGASHPYGYPLGPKLKNRMLEQFLNKKTTTRKQYANSGYGEDLISEFVDVLIVSPHSTIDAILTLRPSLNDIGRFAIAMVLAPCETYTSLFPPKDWYQYFYHRLHLDDPRIPVPPLSIVTFNYDRSLEYYLHHTVETTLEGELLESAKEKLARIPIVHVHGQLGPYPELRYGFHDDTALIKEASKGIRIVSDLELDKSQEFVEAFELMSKASNILFLGFGYDEQNLSRLRMREIRDGKSIHGTAYELGNRKQVEDYFEGSIELGLGNHPTLSFLRDSMSAII